MESFLSRTPCSGYQFTDVYDSLLLSYLSSRLFVRSKNFSWGLAAHLWTLKPNSLTVQKPASAMQRSTASQSDFDFSQLTYSVRNSEGLRASALVRMRKCLSAVIYSSCGSFSSPQAARAPFRRSRKDPQARNCCKISGEVILFYSYSSLC
jgi:hypothetical protein